MPNWCNNQIKILGSKENMKPIVEKLRAIEDTKEFVMATLLGTDDRPDNYEKEGWYNYNTSKFGTKWDFTINDIPHFIAEDNLVEIDTDTAWSPPIEFLENLCSKYNVSATIIFSEPGCDFAGKIEIDENGERVYDDTLSYLDGLYKYTDDFWYEVDFRAEMAVDNGDTFHEFEHQFNFLEGDDKTKRLKEAYDEHVEKSKSFD